MKIPCTVQTPRCHTSRIRAIVFSQLKHSSIRCFCLTQNVARRVGASINRAATSPWVVLCQVRYHLQILAVGQKHYQLHVALSGPFGLEHLRVHDQPVTILHQQVPV